MALGAIFLEDPMDKETDFTGLTSDLSGDEDSYGQTWSNNHEVNTVTVDNAIAAQQSQTTTVQSAVTAESAVTIQSAVTAEPATTAQLESSMAANQAPNLFSPGTILSGRYELLKNLGSGGMGKVFHALDRMTKQPCAIKVMHSHLARNDADLKRFEREANVTIGLKHENIVDVLDFGFIDDSKPFIVMEYIQGQSLADILDEQHRLSLSDFVTVFKQICQGISYAHDSGVVHRDIKPSNIMIVNVKGPLKVKIVDFGIAKRCKTTGEICPTTAKTLQLLQLSPGASVEFDSEALQHLTQPGEIFGSPLYMSPEQCRGEEADCRSEVYALGCMMFEALTGVPPLKGRSAIETVIRRITDIAPSINDAVPSLSFPAYVEYVIARALQHNPDDRYQTVENLSAAVAALL
jgi:serine/threonine-protein kinase